MYNSLISQVIKNHQIKVVSEFDLNSKKVSYSGINQFREINEITGDEEITRALLLSRLVNDLGYSQDKIEIEREYTAGRPHTITSRIDVVVRDSSGDAFLFIEVKSPSEYKTVNKEEIIKEQLYKLSSMEKAENRGVKYIVLYTIGIVESKVLDECMIIDIEKYPTFEDWEKDFNYSNTLPIRYGKAQHIPYIKASQKDLEKTFTGEMLNQLQKELHNVLWGGGGTDDNDVFASLSNLILAKIQDEDSTEDGDTYKFQSLTYEKEGDEEFESQEELFERINTLYRNALKSKLYILDESELSKSYVIDSKKFSLSKLKYAVQKLEGLSFVDGKNSLSGKDILGDFFEGIIHNGFKQSKGQFFTHINIVKFMLWAAKVDRLAISKVKNDKELPYMIDPSAGSGTFLIEYMKFITENLKYRFRSELGTTRAVKDKIESDWFYPNHRENKWAQTYIYASESNFNLGTATKVNMILHGDGSTNIFVKDGLLPFNNYEKETAPNAMNHSEEDINYYGKDINGNFDLILTNPPFSVDLDNDTKKSIGKSFVFGEKKNSENLFIERWYQLLRENGRLAAVLPESVFDTSENKYIRIFIYKYFKIKAIVSLPQISFAPYTSTKTSILFAQKKTKNEINHWNKLWGDASVKYSRLKTRVENLISVYDGTKEKKKLSSIRDLDINEERLVLIEILKNNINPVDVTLSPKEIIEKYRQEFTTICKVDNDTCESFGYVNLWWVFSEIAELLDYEILMAEAENVGYKRTKRGEKDMPNDLFDIENAPDLLDVSLIETDFNVKSDQIDELIKKEISKKIKENRLERVKQIDEKINEYEEAKTFLKREKDNLFRIIEKYYDENGKLKDQYYDRLDDELVKEFKNGRLKEYRSERVLIRKNAKLKILDLMRQIDWN